MKKIAVILILFPLLAVLLVGQINARNSLLNKNNYRNDDISVILTGFGSKDEEGNWKGETAPLIKKLEKLQDVGSKIGTCQIGYEGYLYGSKVLVASSGMAKVKTTACLTDIFRYYNKSIKEVILVGIAGITPSKGGMLDGSGNYRVAEPAVLGDLCINSLAYDFDLQHYSSDQAGSKLPDPIFWDQGDIFSSRYTKSDMKLAQELYDASGKVDWSAAPQSVNDINILYHSTSRAPKVWSMKECLEATSDLYWNDIKLDRRAREIGARYLNQVFESSLNSEDILIVTSMEALPAGLVVEWWNRSNGQNVSFSYVRGASNFDHPYLNSDKTPALDGQESVEKLSQSGGVEYAIETAALPVIKMFELRSNPNR